MLIEIDLKDLNFYFTGLLRLLNETLLTNNLLIFNLIKPPIN
jgi:hypothetical protein